MTDDPIEEMRMNYESKIEKLKQELAAARERNSILEMAAEKSSGEIGQAMDELKKAWAERDAAMGENALKSYGVNALEYLTLKAKLDEAVKVIEFCQSDIHVFGNRPQDRDDAIQDRWHKICKKCRHFLSGLKTKGEGQ